MPNGFERHGIRHLSPSSLALYRAEPHLWCLRYLHKVPDEADKPAAWRGSAVEAGLDHHLFGADYEASLKVALQNFELNAQGLADDKTDKQRGIIKSCLRSAVAAFENRQAGKPNGRQHKIETWVDGVPIPIIGVIDYLWDDWLADLKTTERRPSSPRADHAAQVATYWKATNRKPWLLYAAPSGFAWFEFDQTGIEEAWRTIEYSARAIGRLLNATRDAKEAASLFAPRFDDFRWTPNLKTEAIKLIA
jgi:hypothetical protein